MAITEIVVVCDAGVYVNPLVVGETTYEPFANPLNAKLPEESAVVVAVEAPLKDTAADGPPVPAIVPV